MVHGLPPGGSVDGIVRIIADGLSGKLGQQLVVDARPGAGATLAAGQVARSAPDGYTLLGIPSGHAVSAAMYRKLAYRPVEDFTFISTVTEYPFVLVTHPDHPAKTLKDLVAAGRAQKEPLLYGGPNGTLQHLSVELFGRTANIRVQLVPYRGSPQAVADLLGKRLDFMLDPPTAHLEAIKSGQLRALATTGDSRFFALPDVPTVAEQGIGDFVIGSWQGVIGPAGMPDDIVKRLNKEISAVLAEPAVVARLKALGNDPKPSTPDEFRQRVASDIDRWTKVVAAANIERI
jgi:tripartite-type tricarboxylate transporter receptor subunit TctC